MKKLRVRDDDILSINVVDNDFNGVPVMGWFCSVCYEYAQVMTCGETLCIKHAKEWQHGYGKSLKELTDEPKMPIDNVI